jgi:hypothetical protein
MTEEEFFMGFAEMFKAIEMSSAAECLLWVSTLIIAGSVGTVAFIALGDAIKSFKRRFSRRANPIISVSPPPRRKRK